MVRAMPRFVRCIMTTVVRPPNAIATDANNTNAIGAFGNVPIDQFSQAGVIDRAVLQHGGNHGGNAAGDGLKSFRHGE